MNIKDEDLIKSMCENEKAKFEVWLDELNKVHSETKHYGEGLLENLTGIYCWFDYFVGGYTAREAIDEDLSSAH